MNLPPLPELPEPKLYPSGTYPDGVLTYNADQLRAYALSYGRAVQKACADVVSGFIERDDKAWLSDIAAAIRNGVIREGEGE